MESKQKESAKKEESPGFKPRNLFLAVLILAVIFAFLLFGLKYLSPKSDPYETVYYNSFKFQKIEGMWYTEWQKDSTIYTIPLRFNPYEVEDVPIIGNFSSDFNKPQIYIAFDPTQGNFTVLTLAGGELSLNMYRALKVTPVAACTVNETETCESRPIVSINCSENKNMSIIFIRDVGKPLILSENECIYLGGEGRGLLKSVDKLLYKWYKIM